MMEVATPRIALLGQSGFSGRRTYGGTCKTLEPVTVGRLVRHPATGPRTR
jgi:hypothetical protein